MPAVVNREICTGCAGSDRPECIEICPYDAVRLADGRALADEDICNECKICIELCPVHAIELK